MKSEPEAGQKEILTSWSLFILISLLIIALFTSYLLQTRKIQAVHETVISIFTGKSMSNRTTEPIVTGGYRNGGGLYTATWRG